MSKSNGSVTVAGAASQRDPGGAYDRARHGIHNLRRPEVIAEPRRYWEAISELPPLFYDEVGAVWVCSGYQESVDILANHRTFSSARYHSGRDLEERGMAGLVPTAEMMSVQMLFNDPPEHTRLRKALKDEFAPARVARRDAAMREIADGVLATLPESGTLDLVQDFAAELPALLNGHLLGIPDRTADLTRWAEAYDQLISSVSTFPSRADLATVPVLGQALAALRALAGDRRAAPGQDLISTLVTALHDDPDPLALTAANALVLVGGGYQTLTHLVSTALLLLQRHPDQMRRLRADHSLIDSTVNEVMRLDGSSQYVGRHALREAHVGGVRIAAGENVLVLLGAAGLDPRKFPRPTAFDIGRNQGRHLGFGSGPHYCLGAPFAERLAGWAILGFLERYESYAPAAGEAPVWGPHANTRCLLHARLTVSRGTRGAGEPAGDRVRHQILAEWNQPDTGPATPQCWHLLFERMARLAPGAVAVEDEGVPHTYGEVDAQANALAHRLREHGVEPEAVVAVCMRRSAALIVAMLAVAKAGGAFLLVEDACPGERLRAMLEEVTTRLILADGTTADRLAALGLPAKLLRPEAGPGEPEPPITGVTQGNTAYVVFTSGTTGRPKAIATDHQGLANVHVAQRRVLRIRPDDRVLQFLSLNFDGCVSEIVLALLCGATLVMAGTARRTPGPPLARLLRERAVTAAIMTPSVWSVLPDDALPALRIVAFAGERLSPRLVRRWSAPGRRLLNLYGPAEAAIWTTWHECSAEDGEDGADPPIGRPIEGKRVYVLDEHRELLAPGHEGELYVGGIGLGRYLGHPDRMTEAFVPDPFAAHPGRLLYRTGDICAWRPDGTLEYRGRRDRQVKVRGQRVELDEVERILERAPGVHACQVFERDGRLEASVMVEPERWQETEVRAHLADHLHSGMIPARFTVTDRLALTGNGKRAAAPQAEPPPRVTTAPLAEEAPSAEVAPRADTASRGDREISRITWQIAQLYSSCLRLPPSSVKLETDFFSVGADSLAMAEFLTALEARFDIRLDVEQLLADPTLADLARLVGERGR
ncbi:amino acid adenylation domain-containing protein [Actinomadura sp. NTSP31]|uniref:amino acid adenylation domain-containing protein n=1 Tax=Actinomadura sp. NTSP31 TaxID=1735447 RepID=UPI0035BF4281